MFLSFKYSNDKLSTHLENRENMEKSGNFTILEKSGNSLKNTEKSGKINVVSPPFAMVGNDVVYKIIFDPVKP